MSGEWMNHDTFVDFAAKLAAELGLELDQSRLWTWCVFLVSYDGDGTGYSLTRPRGSAMTEVTPIYPPTSWPFPGGQRGKIGVSISRGPHTVAVEISRRLTQEYRDNLAAIAGHEATVADLAARRAALTDRITGMFPKVAAPSHCQSNHSTDLIVYGPDSGGGDLRFFGAAEEIQFYRFRVPAAVALAMLRVYAEAIKAGVAEDTPRDSGPPGTRAEPRPTGGPAPAPGRP